MVNCTTGKLYRRAGRSRNRVGGDNQDRETSAPREHTSVGGDRILPHGQGKTLAKRQHIAETMARKRHANTEPRTTTEPNGCPGTHTRKKN